MSGRMTPHGLPLVPAGLPDGELGVALYTAASILEQKSRTAKSARTFQFGKRAWLTAAALALSAQTLIDSNRSDVPTGRNFVEARESLAELVRLARWYEPELHSYWSALGERLTEQPRSWSEWPKLEPVADSTTDANEPPSDEPDLEPAADGYIGPDIAMIDLGDLFPSGRSQTSTSVDAFPSRLWPTRGPAFTRRTRVRPGKRRFLVLECDRDGQSTWAVGCQSLESTLRAFDRRVTRNLLRIGEVRPILAIDRLANRAVVWTSTVMDFRGTTAPPEVAGEPFGTRTGARR